jgi:dihydroflavonol-4-reductase
MQVLVTGGSGFLGSAVVRESLRRGHEVRALVRAESPRANLEGLDVRMVVGDLRDPSSLRAACAGCQAVFHVAADYRLWSPRPDELYQSNVEGTENLVRAAGEAGCERLVYTSSVAVLGIDAGGVPSSEETPSSLDDMIGHYKRSKFLAEQTVFELVESEHSPVVIVNPSTPIGPRDIRPTPTGRTILEAARGKVPAFVDTGLNVVHVDDVARGHWLAFERGQIGERYILGGENMSLQRILEVVAVHLGQRPPTLKLPRALLLPIAHLVEAWCKMSGAEREPLLTVDGLRMAKKRMYFTSAKAERELGYQWSAADKAICDAVDWFREAGYLERAIRASRRSP